MNSSASEADSVQTPVLPPIFLKRAGISGDDVRKKLVLDAGDFVLEPKLALFEAREPKLVPLGRSFERDDSLVEIPMFLPQLCELVT